MKNELDFNDIDDFLDEDFINLKATKKKKKLQKETEEYVNKHEMWTELSNYYDILDNSPTANVPLKLASMVDDIITRMAQLPNFSGYKRNSDWLADMIGDARIKAFKSVTERSFKLYCTTIITRTIKKENYVVYYYPMIKNGKHLTDKKTKEFKYRNRKNEVDDVLFIQDGEQYITFKTNPFAFYSQLVWHCFINRIKKEQQSAKALHTYQSDMYEKMYASDEWKDVRRQKIIYDFDDDDSFIIETNE